MYQFRRPHPFGSGKNNALRWSAKALASIAFVSSLLVAPVCAAQAPTPEVLYYQFDQTGTTVTNRASSPPVNTASATLMGGQTQNSSITGTYLKAVVGTGISSNTDYVNTGWATNLTGSWSVSFFSSEILSSASTYYVIGDVNANEFRIFSGGVAGAGNWIIRGTTITDTYINGGAASGATMNTFVYDSTTQQITAYLNGVLVSTVAQVIPATISGPGPFKVAGYSTSSGLSPGGKMGDVRVYSRALSPAEITDIYNAAFIEPVVEVPTLTQTALILLSLLVGAFGVFMVQRRNSQNHQF